MAALRSTLKDIGEPRSAILRHIDLRSLQMEKRRKKVPVSSTNLSIFLHRKHPLVSELLKEGPTDPCLLALLASVLHTAVKIHLEEVTDGDEAQFHALLLKHPLKA